MEVCLLFSVSAFKQNLGLDSCNHLVPLRIFVTGRSGFRLSFKDKFQLITPGLLHLSKESYEWGREVLIPKFYPAFQFVKSHGIFLGNKLDKQKPKNKNNSHSTGVTTHGVIYIPKITHELTVDHAYNL